jgi:hypothetical protein
MLDHRGLLAQLPHVVQQGSEMEPRTHDQSPPLLEMTAG